MDLLEKPFNRAELLAVLHKDLSRSNRQVLIVDDDADARNLIAGYVAEDGADIRTAANGREVLEVLKAFTPDLIVLDLLMPEIDGIALLHVLHDSHAHQHIPVVVVTAKDISPAEARFISQEAQAVLRKDGKLEEELRSVIQTIAMRTAPSHPTGARGDDASRSVS